MKNKRKSVLLDVLCALISAVVSPKNAAEEINYEIYLMENCNEGNKDSV